MHTKETINNAGNGLSWTQRRPFLLRFILVCGLAFLLCLPLLMIGVTIQERVVRAAAMENEIRASWGGDQTIVGPIWEIPFRYPVVREEWTGVADQRRSVQQREWVEAKVHLLPETLKARAVIVPSERSRGLFRATVYRADWVLEGEFDPQTLEIIDLPKGAELRWAEAKLVLSANDWRGVDRSLTVQLGSNAETAFRQRLAKEGGLGGLEALAPPGKSGEKISFSFQVPLQGSGGLSLVPVGKHTELVLESTWSDPSFRGARLPYERVVTAAGFTARWVISEYSQNLPRQAWKGALEEPFPLARFQAEAVGVRIEPAISPHRMAERAIKYGFLFVVFVLGVFFAFNVTGGTGLQTIHYLWVGLATCLFFLVLLALHEVWPFAPAYFAAATVTTAMVVLFSHGLVGTTRRSGALAGTLVGVFGYLYVVLRSEDYALLAGALALLVALGVAMRLTRTVAS